MRTRLCGWRPYNIDLSKIYRQCTIPVVSTSIRGACEQVELCPLQSEHGHEDKGHDPLNRSRPQIDAEKLARFLGWQYRLRGAVLMWLSLATVILAVPLPYGSSKVYLPLTQDLPSDK